MRLVVSFLAACAVAGSIACPSLRAAEEVDSRDLVASPRSYVGKTVTITVRFGRVSNIFRGWEDQANLNRKLKFAVSPLSEIACYADRTDENEELISNLKPGQEMTLTGHIKKGKIEARIKGERHTVKRTVKGAEAYGFVVTRIDSVGKTGAAGGPRGMMRRMMRQ